MFHIEYDLRQDKHLTDTPLHFSIRKKEVNGMACGADGCWFQNRSTSGHVDSLKNIKVVDTTGAGDIFGGSAVWKLLQTGKAPEDLSEAELREIVSFACKAAGLSTTMPGGISSVPELL